MKVDFNLWVINGPTEVCGGSCAWTRGTTSSWGPRIGPISLESSSSAFSPRSETLWGEMKDTCSERKKQNPDESITCKNCIHSTPVVLNTIQVQSDNLIMPYEDTEMLNVSSFCLEHSSLWRCYKVKQRCLVLVRISVWLQKHNAMFVPPLRIYNILTKNWL